jgi:hypothetical protein
MQRADMHHHQSASLPLFTPHHLEPLPPLLSLPSLTFEVEWDVFSDPPLQRYHGHRTYSIMNGSIEVDAGYIEVLRITS